jgi:hypothetical protein
MTDDDNFKQLILANTRECNGFWFWRDKPVGESGAARNILEAAKVQVTGLKSLDQDPPDCEATLDGQFSGIEVTELVHRPTLERSIKAVRQRSRGEEPVGDDGHFINSRGFSCDNDPDAIVWAKQLVDGDDIELRSGARLISRLERKPK